MSMGASSILSEVSCGFPRSLKANSGVVGHSHFLTDPLQFNIHRYFSNPKLYSLDTNRVANYPKTIFMYSLSCQ
jgi:hypothetical protein